MKVVQIFFFFHGEPFLCEALKHHLESSYRRNHPVQNIQYGPGSPSVEHLTSKKNLHFTKRNRLIYLYGYTPGPDEMSGWTRLPSAAGSGTK